MIHGLCSNCGEVLPMGEDFPIAVLKGDVFAFCDTACSQHWLDDSQEGAALKEALSSDA